MTLEMNHFGTPESLLDSCENEAHLTLWADAFQLRKFYNSLSIGCILSAIAKSGDGSDYRADVYNGTAAHRDRTTSES